MSLAMHCFLVAAVVVIFLSKISLSGTVAFGPQSESFEEADDCPSLCSCNYTYREVFCQNQGHKLDYIPKLPSWAEELVFTGNYLPTVTQETFANVSEQTTRLYLETNSIKRMSKDAFEKFTKLVNLSLAKNAVDHKDFEQALFVIGRLPVLKKLDIGKMHLNYISDKFWDGLNNSGIEVLWAYHNSIHKFDLSRLSGMRNLRELDFAGNLISSFITRRNVAPNLESLRLSYNDFHFIPDVCNDGTPIFPKLKCLDLSYNNVWYVKPYQVDCLKQLDTLKLSGNRMQNFERNFLTGMEALTDLELSYIRVEGNVPRNFTSLGKPPKIQRVKMINAEIRIGHDNFSPEFFEGCGSLTHLYLGRNFFSLASEEFFFRLLQPLRNLTLLDLSSGELHRIPRAVSQLENLREVWLFNNYIATWPASLFTGLTSLRNISLDMNQITSIDETTFPPALVEDLLALNLSMNPFSCTCDILWFLDWMRTNTSLFTGGPDNYQCASPPSLRGLPLLQLPFTESYCLLSHESSGLIIVIIAILICLFIAVPLVFRYRWHLQSAVFMMRYRTMREESRRERRRYKYDAFLIYSDTDSPRVWREFLPRLEQDRGLHLCVHERDFLPGKWIMDNIVDSMLTSRCVVVLLSNALATSEWCQFELNLAHAEVLESGAAPLVLLLLEDIVPHNMTPTLYAVLKTTTYLRYPDLPRDAEAFWNHVHQAVTDPERA